MSDNPLISVVIPVYKVENYLRECLDSVISQTYKNLDIILVDDGSPDNCPAICDEYAEKDSRIKVIHRKNGGLSAARNSGIDIARGEYITFIDSDDYVSRAYVERLYSIIEASGADMSCCTFTVHTHKLSAECSGSYSMISPADAVIQAISLGTIGRAAFCKLYRTEIFTSGGIHYPEGIVCEDLAVMPEVFGAAKKIAYTDSAMYFYRLREDSIMHTIFSSKSMDYYTVLSMAEESAQKIFPEEWPRMSKHFRDDCIQVTMKILRDFCLSADRNSPEYAATISSLTERITLRGAISLMSSRATLPKKMAALLTALAPKLAVKIIERSRKYVPAYN